MSTRRNLEAKLARLLAHPSTDVLWYHGVGRCLLALKGITDYKAHCVRTAARTAKQHRSTFARELASFLHATARADGYFEGQGYQVTWALGHLATLKEPEDYDPALKRWSLEKLPIVPACFGLKLIEDKGARKQFAIIKRLFRSADELICATDAGREGELIFRYILDLAGCTGKPARRLWLSSLTEAAIRDAFRRLRPLSDYDALYAAARCRSEADWIVGLNATRNYTVRHRSGGVLWSVGRVQTPVLAMIVRRDDEIRAFRPEPFWELLTRYREVTFKFAGERLAKEEGARTLLERAQGHPFTIRGVERKEERVQPPQLYDLTELQRDMNRRYGMSADATLKAAQALYERKAITYPRTDSRYLGSDMRGHLPRILGELRSLKPAEVGKLDLGALAFTARIIDDKKVSDHHAIIPTGKMSGALSPDADRVYDAVVVRLIAAFCPACVREVTSVAGVSNGVPFRAKGVRVLEPGWTALYPRKDDDRKDDEQDLPEFRPGESGPHEPFVRRGETTPPKPFTEGTLLGAMETAGKLVDDEELKEALKKRGLGTPATRAAIIETLLARGYITRMKKALAATDQGRYLVAVVQDRALKSPELTGEWEAKLREIERGRLDPRQFMAEIVQYTGEVIRSGDAGAVDPTRLGDCPRCGRPVIEGRRGFGCSGWHEGCPFVLWREYRGHALGDEQIRELLQRRVLLGPMTFGDPVEVILTLTDSGALTEIPVPSGRPQRPASSEGRKRVSRRRGPGTSQNERASSDGPGSSQGEQAPAKPAGGLGPCPFCGSEVVEQEKSYGCSSWRSGCKFAIWKTIAGKRISARTAQALLRRGRSPVLKGFKSKSGKAFDARLKLEQGEVRFDFES
jgi:DNA topoisomerase III